MKFKKGSQWIQRINDDPKGVFDTLVTIKLSLTDDLVATIHADVDRTAYFDSEGTRLDGAARLMPLSQE